MSPDHSSADRQTFLEFPCKLPDLRLALATVIISMRFSTGKQTEQTVCAQHAEGWGKQRRATVQGTEMRGWGPQGGYAAPSSDSTLKP